MLRHSLLGLAVAVAFGWLGPVAADATRAAPATLKKIASKLEKRAGVISIEASAPVAYVASQPDPRTFVVELLEVLAAGFKDSVTIDPRQPFAGVQVESAQTPEGVSLTRVRMALAHPLRPRVRSARNVIYVEADRVDGVAAPGALATTRSPAVGVNETLLDPVAALRQSSGPAPGALSAVLRLQAPPAPVTQPTPPPTGSPQAPGPQAQPSRFTGFPITFDMQDADLRAVLRTFAEISSLNLVIDPSIQGTVNVSLRDVPWDQVLDVILKANKLGAAIDGTIVRIAPLTVLAEEEEQRQKLAAAQALAGELRVMTRSLSYAKAAAVGELLKTTVLSSRGSVQTDDRTNTLIINDLADRLAQADALVATLDRPEPQVEIEARIVQTTREFARRLGVQWGGNARAATALGNTFPQAFPNQGSITGRTGATQGAPAPDPGSDAVSSVVNLGVTGATSAVGLALGSINGAVNLDVALSAIEENGQGRILSTPRVQTQNNVEAEITQGVQIPIQTVANNTVTVTFQDAALTLKVLPQITAANTVIMRIQLQNAAPDFSRSVNNIPPIDTQRAITQVLVNNAETTVIGGIYVSREQASQDRTPGLHRIPILGWLFRRDEISDESRELLIFITPRIMRLP
jgi:type IV pilus assembly protein PilQ